MSFRGLKFELDERIIEKRRALAQTLIQEDLIKKFMEDHHVGIDVIEAEAYRFEAWVTSKKRVDGLDVHYVKEHPSEGSYVALTMENHILTEVIVKGWQLQEIEKASIRDSYFKAFPLPKSFESISLKHYYEHKDQESPSTLALMLKLGHFVTDQTLGYFIYGNVGVGKSFIAAAALQEFASQRKPVAFVNVSSLMQRLKQLFNQPDEMEQLMQSLLHVHCLVLDDLGAEPITSWSRDEILLTIINDRLENQKKTIITSNFPLHQLQRLYRQDAKGTIDDIRAERLIDRIEALCIPYHLEGKNRRNKPKTT